MSIIAMLCGALGMGGGAFIVPLLQRYELDMRKCVGTSSGLGTLVAIPGTIGHLVAGYANADLPPETIGHVHWMASLSLSLALSRAHRLVRASPKNPASSCGRFWCGAAHCSIKTMTQSLITVPGDTGDAQLLGLLRLKLHLARYSAKELPMNILSRTLFPIFILGLSTACTSTDSSVPPAQTEPSTANERQYHLLRL